MIALMIIVSPIDAGYTSSVNHNGGTSTTKSAVYSSALDGGYKFGSLSGTLNEQGATHATLTLGRSGVARDMSVSASTSNSYESTVQVESAGMVNSFDNLGMTDLRSNIPATICDAEGNIIAMDSNLSSSRYPSEQRVSQMVGTMSSNVGGYIADVGMVNDNVLTSTRLQAANYGSYLMNNIHTSATKGFNKSDSSYGYNNQITEHDLLQADEFAGIDDGKDTSYNGFKDAYDKVLNVTTVNEYSSNKTVVDNQTSDQVANLTEVNLTSNLTFGEAT